MFCYYMYAIAMNKNNVFHVKSKLIELRHNLIIDLVEEGEIDRKFINTKE